MISLICKYFQNLKLNNLFENLHNYLQNSYDKFHLGFLIYEKNHTDNLNYCIHVTRQFDKFYNIENQKYLINDFENYCCFWLYDKIEAMDYFQRV